MRSSCRSDAARDSGAARLGRDARYGARRIFQEQYARYSKHLKVLKRAGLTSNLRFPDRLRETGLDSFSLACLTAQ